MSARPSTPVAARLSAATAGLPAPLAVIDLDAFDANAATLVSRAHGLPIRIATKSLRSRPLIQKLHSHPGIDLRLMLGGAILLDKYSSHIAEDIERGGFTISTSYFNVIEGGNHVAMAKTACLDLFRTGSPFPRRSRS